MVCFCLLPSCRFCGTALVSSQGHRAVGEAQTAPVSSQGHRVVDEARVASQVGEALVVAPSCSCFLPTCHYCSSVATPIVWPVSSQGNRVVDEHVAVSRVGEALAVASRCSCCLPGCCDCFSVASSTARQARPQPRKEARQSRKRGHKRPLSQELVEDSGRVSGPDSWLRAIHLPASREKHLVRLRAVTDVSPGPWEFWELWSGCGNFTAAVLQAGGRVGPSVDILPSVSVPRLLLDFEDDSDVEFLWYLLRERRPRFVHAAPPSTFWGQPGRATAVRTQAEWAALRRQAVRHLKLAVMILRWQSERGGKGSLEQPPGSISWRLRRTEALLSQPGWRRFTWPSCAYGFQDDGRPYRKAQAFASNVNLATMKSKCLCAPGTHKHRKRRDAIDSGEYPPAMCSKLAGLILNKPPGWEVVSAG